MHRMTPILLLVAILVAGCRAISASDSTAPSKGTHTARTSTPRNASGTASTPTPSSATTGGGSPTISPTRDSTAGDVQVYADCHTPRTKPRVIILTCADAAVSVTNLHWTSWTARHAYGIGTLRYNDCTPNCAEGRFHDVPVTRITLTRPVPDLNGHLVWSRSQEKPLPPGWATGPLHGAPEPLPTRPT